MNYLYAYYTEVIFLTFIVINHLTEIYLSRRQLETLQLNQAEVPSEFKSFITLDDHQKAISYSTSKLKLGQMHLIFDAILLFYWFPFRGAEKLYLTLPEVGLHREVLFLVSFSFIQFLLNLPWSIYSTFVLEESFGFNKSTPKIFVLDRIKGLALGAILGIPLLYMLIFLYQTLGQWWWFVSFIVLTTFQFILLWLYPSFIAPLFNKFRPLENEQLQNGIEGLVSNAGFKAQGVFVMDASKRSSHGNAYFTGLGKNKRVVFFDTLLEKLENSEVLAILAHELGHLKLKHIPKSIATSLALSFIGLFLMGKFATEAWFYNGHFLRIISPGALFLIFMQAVPMYTFWFGPIGSWISRKREFEADAYAATEARAEDLISGLLKLYKNNASPVVSDKIYSGFYYSHPPALERIKKLESLKR
ncbi:MAG: M48 family metallopeptidase [Bacteriovoracaceae bacterium]